MAFASADKNEISNFFSLIDGQNDSHKDIQNLCALYEKNEKDYLSHDLSVISDEASRNARQDLGILCKKNGSILRIKSND